MQLPTPLLCIKSTDFCPPSHAPQDEATYGHRTFPFLADGYSFISFQLEVNCGGEQIESATTISDLLLADSSPTRQRDRNHIHEHIHNEDCSCE